MQLITLTSDFGAQNYMLAAVKGKIHALIPHSVLVDVAHDIASFNIQQTAFIFKQSMLQFPQETVHLVLTDLYDNPNNQLLYVYESGQHIFCADNGFLTMLFDDQPLQIFRLTDNVSPFQVLPIVEAMCNNAMLVLQGNKIFLENISIQEIRVKRPTHASYQNNILDAQVLHIDAYGNVILNVTKTQFEELRQQRKFTIHFMRHEELNIISNYYYDVEQGEVLCLFNAANYLEIAVNKGSAAQLFGFQEQGSKRFFYNQIKIFFE